MIKMRDLTLNDVKHLTVRSGCSPVDVLSMVCQVAFDMYQKDEFQEEPAATHNTNHKQKKKKKKHAAAAAIILPDFKMDNNVYGCQKRNNHYNSNSFVYNGTKLDDDLQKLDGIRKRKRTPLRDNDDNNDEKLAREKDLTKRPTKKRVWFENSGEGEGECNASASANVNKKKKKPATAMAKIADHGPNPPPDMLKNLKSKIADLGGSDVKLVVQKRLYKTDTTTEHNRLSVPLSQVREKFLWDEEEAFLNSHSGKNVSKMEVRVIEPNDELLVSKISLRRWNMNKESGRCSSSYVLAGSWNILVSKNRIEPGMVLQLWSFRVEEELGFALVRLP